MTSDPLMRVLPNHQRRWSTLPGKTMSMGSSSATELKRFSRSHGYGSSLMFSAVTSLVGFDAAGTRRAELYRLRSGDHKTLRGLRFISSRPHGDSWNEVEGCFDKLPEDGFPHRSDFAQCKVKSMGLKAILPYLLVCYLFFNYKWVEGSKNLSKEEALELDEQLKPAAKTIKTKYGDIYDCVDFYKQPAFDHPLLKNHNFHPEMQLTSSIPRRVSPEKKVPKINFEPKNIGLEGGGCPVGTVPIRRTTKVDLIRAKMHSEMHASKINSLANNKFGAHYAVAQTKQKINYDGVGADLSVWNLPVQASQYTSGRIKIRNGDESLEAGWTVNPGLYGDDRTRLYIYTNAGRQSHCFNAQCGYVHLSREIPLDVVLEPVSSYGGKQYGITLSIVREGGGKRSNWLLQWDDPPVNLGFWAGGLFTNLGKGASQAEWGGEVFSPPNLPLPGMGSGHRLRSNTQEDAFCGRVHIVINNTIINPPNDLDILFDDNYGADYRDVGGAPQFLIFYGGPGGATAK